MMPNVRPIIQQLSQLMRQESQIMNWSSAHVPPLGMSVVSCGLIEADYGGSLKHSLGPFLIHEGDQNRLHMRSTDTKAMTS